MILKKINLIKNLKKWNQFVLIFETYDPSHETNNLVEGKT